MNGIFNVETWKPLMERVIDTETWSFPFYSMRIGCSWSYSSSSSSTSSMKMEPTNPRNWKYIVHRTTVIWGYFLRICSETTNYPEYKSLSNQEVSPSQSQRLVFHFMKDGWNPPKQHSICAMHWPVYDPVFIYLILKMYKAHCNLKS